MAEALLPHKLFTTIHKHYAVSFLIVCATCLGLIAQVQVEEWKEFQAKFKETPMFSNIAVSSGISDRDLEKAGS